MSDLSSLDKNELKGRLEYLLRQIDDIFHSIGPQLEKYGRHRHEVALLVEELQKRGLLPKETDGK